MARNNLTRSSIVYFDEEGRENNLRRVLQAIRQCLKERPEIRTVVFMTARGEGPVLAYNQLQGIEPEPKIIAVTFPVTFAVKHGEDWVHPDISPKTKAFFKGVGIPVLKCRLPWDQIEGADGHNREVALIKNAVAMFGGSFPLCIQAVLQACDMGAVEPQQQVIAAAGDCAAIVTATATQYVFSRRYGLAVNEILCKARTPTMLYEWAKKREPIDENGALQLPPPTDVI